MIRLILFACIGLITSCGFILGRGKPKLENRAKAKYIEEEYRQQPIKWEAYMYYHDSIHNWNDHESRVSLKPQDSVINIVKPLFINHPLLNIVDSDTLINRINPEITSMSLFLRPTRITNDMILKHIKDSDTYFFPVFYTSRSWSYSTTGGYTFMNTIISASDEILVLCYIIENKKVIYKRSARLLNPPKWYIENDKPVFISTIKPEDWKLVIDKALEDYIKRIKK